jgi:nucleotide-binding universal stress UspA family protein
MAKAVGERRLGPSGGGQVSAVDERATASAANDRSCGVGGGRPQPGRGGHGCPVRRCRVPPVVDSIRSSAGPRPLAQTPSVRGRCGAGGLRVACESQPSSDSGRRWPRSAADGLALLLAQRLAEATCCDLESLSHSEAARLHRATGRIGRRRRTIHSCPPSLLDSAADLVVVADSGHTSLRRVRPAASRILLRGCPVPVLFVSRGLEAHSFMAHADRTEAATHEKADGPGD